MMAIVLGAFLILHGLVYLLYAGQSARLFALKDGMVWPDHSWALAWAASPAPTRLVASVACVIAAAGFLAAGGALLAGQGWWREAAVVTAVFATAAFVLFWDVSRRDLAGQGIIAIIINAAILAGLLAVPRPGLV
jgi:hypothetical protein